MIQCLQIVRYMYTQNLDFHVYNKIVSGKCYIHIICICKIVLTPIFMREHYLMHVVRGRTTLRFHFGQIRRGSSGGRSRIIYVVPLYTYPLHKYVRIYYVYVCTRYCLYLYCIQQVPPYYSHNLQYLSLNHIQPDVPTVQTTTTTSNIVSRPSRLAFLKAFISSRHLQGQYSLFPTPKLSTRAYCSSSAIYKDLDIFILCKIEHQLLQLHNTQYKHIGTTKQ